MFGGPASLRPHKSSCWRIGINSGRGCLAEQLVEVRQHAEHILIIKPGDLKVPDWDGLRAHAIAGDTKQRAEGVLTIFEKKMRPSAALFPSPAVGRMAKVHAGMLHGSVSVPPVTVGVGIAGTHVLTIGVRVELRAIAGVFDDLLRQHGRCESCRSDSSDADQCEFHLGLLVSVTK